jgi:hypothetical protein
MGRVTKPVFCVRVLRMPDKIIPQAIVEDVQVFGEVPEDPKERHEFHCNVVHGWTTKKKGVYRVESSVGPIIDSNKGLMHEDEITWRRVWKSPWPCPCKRCQRISKAVECDWGEMEDPDAPSDSD